MIPTYLDGYFKLFEIKTDNGVQPQEYLKDLKLEFPYEYRSIGDHLKFEAESRKLEITHKVRITQTQLIDSMHVLKIGDKYHQVYNTMHFRNKEGYDQTDITLKNYNKEVIIRDE